MCTIIQSTRTRTERRWHIHTVCSHNHTYNHTIIKAITNIWRVISRHIQIGSLTIVRSTRTRTERRGHIRTANGYICTTITFIWYTLRPSQIQVLMSAWIQIDALTIIPYTCIQTEGRQHRCTICGRNGYTNNNTMNMHTYRRKTA